MYLFTAVYNVKLSVAKAMSCDVPTNKHKHIQIHVHKEIHNMF